MFTLPVSYTAQQHCVHAAEPFPAAAGGAAGPSFTLALAATGQRGPSLAGTGFGQAKQAPARTIPEAQTIPDVDGTAALALAYASCAVVLGGASVASALVLKERRRFHPRSPGQYLPPRQNPEQQRLFDAARTNPVLGRLVAGLIRPHMELPATAPGDIAQLGGAAEREGWSEALRGFRVGRYLAGEPVGALLNDRPIQEIALQRVGAEPTRAELARRRDDFQAHVPEAVRRLLQDPSVNSVRIAFGPDTVAVCDAGRYAEADYMPERDHSISIAKPSDWMPDYLVMDVGRYGSFLHLPPEPGGPLVMTQTHAGAMLAEGAMVQPFSTSWAGCWIELSSGQGAPPPPQSLLGAAWRSPVLGSLLERVRLPGGQGGPTPDQQRLLDAVCRDPVLGSLAQRLCRPGTQLPATAPDDIAQLGRAAEREGWSEALRGFRVSRYLGGEPAGSLVHDKPMQEIRYGPYPLNENHSTATLEEAERKQELARTAAAEAAQRLMEDPSVRSVRIACVYKSMLVVCDGDRYPQADHLQGAYADVTIVKPSGAAPNYQVATGDAVERLGTYQEPGNASKLLQPRDCVSLPESSFLDLSHWSFDVNIRVRLSGQPNGGGSPPAQPTP